jgi:hypothetical protein
VLFSGCVLAVNRPLRAEDRILASNVVFDVHIGGWSLFESVRTPNMERWVRAYWGYTKAENLGISGELETSRRSNGTDSMALVCCGVSLVAKWPV